MVQNDEMTKNDTIDAKLASDRGSEVGRVRVAGEHAPVVLRRVCGRRGLSTSIQKVSFFIFFNCSDN